MFRKAKGLITRVYDSVDVVNLKSLPKKIILAYISQLFLLVTMYMVALALDYYHTGRFDYPDALALLKVLVSGEAILAIGIICKGVYDKDGDDVPDMAEEQSKGGDPHDPR